MTEFASPTAPRPGQKEPPSAPASSLPGPPAASARSGALLGFAVVGAWLVNDFAVFVTSGRASLALEIVPGSLVALIAGVLLGALFGKSPRWLCGAHLLATLALSALPAVVELPVSRAELWLPRAAFLLGLAWCSAHVLSRRFGLRELPLGAALGLVFSLAMGWKLTGFLEPAPWMAAGCVLLAVASFQTSTARASLLGVTGSLVPLAILTVLHLGERPLPRPDLPPPAQVTTEHPNLLLVVMDTVRAASLQPYGYDVVTMPELDRFARNHATRYHFARSSSSWTLPSHASLFTGRLPSDHGSTHSRSPDFVVYPGLPMREDIPTLAEILRDSGYRTGAIMSNTFALRHNLGLDRGYEHYDDRRGCGVGHTFALAQLTGKRLRAGHVLYRDATWITDLALEWIDRVEESGSFFLTLNYLDAHLPYFPPEPFAGELEPERPIDPMNPPARLLRLQYEREMRYLDSQLARLFAGLRERGLFDDMVIVVTSDHGEAFGDHETWKHDFTLYEEVVRVPLYIKPVGEPEERVSYEPVSSADVFDLSLEAVGIELPELPERPFQAEWYHTDGSGERAVSAPGTDAGLTLERLEEARATVRDLVTFIDAKGRKVVVSSTGEVEVYDLENDLREARPLPIEESERAAYLAHAEAWWEAHPPRTEGSTGVTDEELEAWKEQGAMLGYAGEDEDE